MLVIMITQSDTVVDFFTTLFSVGNFSVLADDLCNRTKFYTKFCMFYIGCCD